jgi:hypothetical protein
MAVNVELALSVATIGSLLTPLLLATGRWLVGRRNRAISEAAQVQQMAVNLASGLEARNQAQARELDEKDREIDEKDREIDFLMGVIQAHQIPFPRSGRARRREDTSEMQL